MSRFGDETCFRDWLAAFTAMLQPREVSEPLKTTSLTGNLGVAVFVGTEFDVIDGRGGHGEPVRKTPWGEIAWQLGNGSTSPHKSSQAACFRCAGMGR